MPIDIEPLVDPLARAICEADGGCVCQAEAGGPCDDRVVQARAAIAYLLPLIVERCAEEAEAESCDNSKAGRLDEAFGAMGACNRIRALIPKGADHA